MHCCCHQYKPHCPYCCPECRPGHSGHYAPPYPSYHRGREPGYEKDAIRDRIEALKDELKAMEERLAQIEGPK